MPATSLTTSASITYLSQHRHQHKNQHPYQPQLPSPPPPPPPPPSPVAAVAEIAAPCSPCSKTLGQFKSTVIGGLIIGEFPSHLDAVVTRTFKSNHLIAPLTGPLHTALHLVGWIYALNNTPTATCRKKQLIRRRRGRPQVFALADLQRAILRCEELCTKLSSLLERYAQSCIGPAATGADAVSTIGQFKFVEQFNVFFEKGLGRYTWNFQVFCPFLEEIGEFNRTTQVLVDEWRGWALEDEEDGDSANREELD